MSVTGPVPSPASGDFLLFAVPIEANRIARLALGAANAQPISVGFWTKANRPGNYSAAIRNGVATRAYLFSFTQAASGVWQFNRVTIPGDTGGSVNWPISPNRGFELDIVMMVGSLYQGAPNTWLSGNLIGVTGTINGAAAVTDYMQVAGVIILPGIELPSASRAPLLMRPYDHELRLCQRYFNRLSPVAGLGYSDATWGLALMWPIMRAIPTVGD